MSRMRRPSRSAVFCSRNLLMIYSRKNQRRFNLTNVPGRSRSTRIATPSRSWIPRSWGDWRNACPEEKRPCSIPLAAEWQERSARWQRNMIFPSKSPSACSTTSTINRPEQRSSRPAQVAAIKSPILRVFARNTWRNYWLTQLQGRKVRGKKAELRGWPAFFAAGDLSGLRPSVRVSGLSFFLLTFAFLLARFARQILHLFRCIFAAAVRPFFDQFFGHNRVKRYHRPIRIAADHRAMPDISRD